MKVDYLITNGEKNVFFPTTVKNLVPGIQNKTNNIEIVKINLFLSYKERTKHTIFFFFFSNIDYLNK